jgi:hypothetical protein
MFLIFDPATGLYLVAPGNGATPTAWGTKGEARPVAEDVAAAMLAGPGGEALLPEYAGVPRDVGPGRVRSRRRRRAA